MKILKKWRNLGWRHPLWDYVRFYSVVQRQKNEAKEAWIANLKTNKKMEIDPTSQLPVPADHVKLFLEYLEERKEGLAVAADLLRSEGEALAFCAKLGITVSKVKTQNPDHHQSSAAMVGAVSSIAQSVALENGMTAIVKPDRRCAWLVSNHLHVTVRNLDGAIPSLAAPRIVWEIKEYWGQTKGGSKMSDAVYECNLVGRELREFEERAKINVVHVVFLDGKEQWSHRPSDLRRFIDLFNQGIIDHLIVGKEVETEWKSILVPALKAKK